MSERIAYIPLGHMPEHHKLGEREIRKEGYGSLQLGQAITVDAL